MALGYQNPCYLKQAQQKQQSLYNGKVLLEKHDPPVVYDLEETLQLAQESRLKMKQLNKEIKPANYTKINHLSGVFVSQMAKSREELYFSNTSKTANVSKSISIPNEEFSDDTTPSVAQKSLNEVKSTIVTLQRVVKQRMTLDIHNSSSFAYQEIQKIVKDEIFPIVNQVDARVQNFEIQFLKEVAKFVRDFQSLANEADESLDKHKALELEIECLLRAVVERLQAQLGDQKGKCKDTPCVSNTLDHLSQKLENENVELEFQVQNYEKENAHLKVVYKNLFDSINVTRAQTKTIIDSLQTKLHDTIYENAKLRANLFDKFYEQKDTTKGTSANTKFAKQSILGIPPFSSRPKLYVVTPLPKSKAIPKIDKSHALSNPITSNSVPTPQELRVVNNDKKVVNSDSNGFSSTGVDFSTKTRRPQLRSNTRNDMVPFACKSSCIMNKEVKVEDHPRNLLLSKNKKHMSSECNNIKLAIRNDKFESVYAMCKQCLITANHDACVLNYVNGMNSRRKKQKANVSNIENQTKRKAQIWKPKNVGPKERLASPKPSKPRMHLRWSPTRKTFDRGGKIITSSDSNGDNACTPNPQEPTIKRFPNSTFFLGRLSKYKFLGTVHFGNDHVAAILGFGDFQWENILITRVYFIEGLGHNLFLVGQFCDSDLEVAFRRNTCFIRNLEGVDLLKGNRTINLYTINLHDMTSASPICLMAHATSTKSWLWHQRLSYLKFYTINDLARNDLVTGLPKFKYHKEHLCPFCEQGKSKRASHPPKPVPNSKQRLHLLHMDLYSPMRITSINGKQYVLVIVDDYSCYTRVVFLRSKDEAPEEIKTFLKRITVLLQAPVIIVRTDNDT
ncbi:retrovirus-related pol polyprotein from transposon TNT 1-94 [Tanacetum coccineum]